MSKPKALITGAGAGGGGRELRLADAPEALLERSDAITAPIGTATTGCG